MEYKLKVSNDLGLSYVTVDCPKTLRLMKKAALRLDRQGSCRWVIVDENDEPVYWCQFHESHLHIPAGTGLATDDPYMRKLAKSRGIKVLSSLDVLHQYGIPNAEDRLAEIDRDIKENGIDQAVLRAMPYFAQLMENQGIEVLKTDFDDSEVGSRLFGADD